MEQITEGQNLGSVLDVDLVHTVKCISTNFGCDLPLLPIKGSIYTIDDTELADPRYIGLEGLEGVFLRECFIVQTFSEQSA